jgi:hypothetical protein
VWRGALWRRDDHLVHVFPSPGSASGPEKPSQGVSKHALLRTLVCRGFVPRFLLLVVFFVLVLTLVLVIIFAFAFVFIVLMLVSAIVVTGALVEHSLQFFERERPIVLCHLILLVRLLVGLTTAPGRRHLRAPLDGVHLWLHRHRHRGGGGGGGGVIIIVFARLSDEAIEV